MTRYANVAAYKFVELDRLPHRRKTLRTLTKQLGLRGTILLSREGINLFVAGDESAVDQLLNQLHRDPKLADLNAKLSFSERIPFRRMLVKIKDEIIALGIDDVRPAEYTSTKLPAEELKKWLDEGRPVTLLDVRNDYEIKIGAFEHAVPIGVSNFRDFPSKAAELPDLLKNQPIVMYCTGGIRCEKAGPVMEQLGFEQIYQLDGGILKYFERCGESHYRGECFVFDQRVAVDPMLAETDTKMCFVCQATLTVDEQASPRYVVGKSCPSCYQSPKQTMQQSIQRRHQRLQQLVSPLPGSTPYENRRPINVPKRSDGVTLWQLITDLHPHVSLDAWQAAVGAGRLQRDGQSLERDAIVRAGERIENVLPGTVEPDVNADIQIVYEDGLIVVVNKPAPLPMHPCGRFNRNTLISILDRLYHPQRLRVAHRLDANTTGIVVLSRSRSVSRLLGPQFQRGEVEKTYLTRVHGHPDQRLFTCDAAISDTPDRAGRRLIQAGGLPARTDFETLRREDDGTALLKAWPRTGRTNQIRLHLAHLGWPVCGDPIYGAPAGAPLKQTLDVDDPPLCLHAWRIRFRHPMDGKFVEFGTNDAAEMLWR